MPQTRILVLKFLIEQKTDLILDFIFDAFLPDYNVDKKLFMYRI